MSSNIDITYAFREEIDYKLLITQFSHNFIICYKSIEREVSTGS